MSDETPDRLSSGSEDPQLRELLDAGRRELPDDKQLAAVFAKLGPVVGPGGGGGGGGAAGGTSGAASKAAWVGAAKWVAVAAGLTAAVWGVHDATRDAGPTKGEAVQIAVSPRAIEANAPSAVTAPPPATVTTVAAEPAKSRTVAPAPSASSPKPTNDLASEIDLVKGAQEALVAALPAKALMLADEHARRFPDGLLREEGEVIAIDALVRMGRRAAAEERAKTFRARFPKSVYLRRIDVILAPPH